MGSNANLNTIIFQVDMKLAIGLRGLILSEIICDGNILLLFIVVI